MKIDISKIKVTERIRKTVNRIDELAADITERGLLNPITVMSLGGGEEYQLLAGLRRLRAVQSLNWTGVEVNILSPQDAEAALRVEISENEQREPFTHSEKLDYGRQIERLESVKAAERRKRKPKESEDFVPPRGAEQNKSETQNIVGSQIGMSGKQYDRLKYIGENAPPEVMKELDRGERTIRRTYDELREKAKTDTAPTAPLPQKAAVAVAEALPPKSVTIDKTPAALPTKTKSPTPTAVELAELKAKKDEFVSKYSMASHKCDVLETQLHNTNLQWQCEREGKNDYIAELTAKVAELETALTAANARIKELEEKYEPDKHTA